MAKEEFKQDSDFKNTILKDCALEYQLPIQKLKIEDASSFPRECKTTCKSLCVLLSLIIGLFQVILQDYNRNITIYTCVANITVTELVQDKSRHHCSNKTSALEVALDLLLLNIP